MSIWSRFRAGDGGKKGAQRSAPAAGTAQDPGRRGNVLLASKSPEAPVEERSTDESVAATESIRRRTGPVDAVLAATVIALIGFGVVMVYSASAIEATVRYKDAQFFLKRQAVYAVLAVIVMAVASRINYRKIKPFTYPILFSVAAMLLATVAGLGHRAGNAYRWLALGPVHVQPAELAKLGIVLWLAYSLSKKRDQIRSFSVGFLPHLLVVGVLMLLCLKQPDFGSAMVLLFLTFTLLFVAGARIPYIAAFSALLALAAAALVRFSGYRYARYLAWIDMESNRADLAYQPFQSVMSFGSGGVSGLGLGRGLQVLYLPEAHTDFISAIVGEELGFLGIVALCCAYLVIVARGVKAALAADDDYGSFIAFGIATLFGVQAMVNLSVAMAILPTKGLTLPLVSYGGSSLIVNALGAGILLSISRSPGTESTTASPREAARLSNSGVVGVAAVSRDAA
ncbi:putative lipid II flippase FtsW [Chondromyces crocatus]|uniref:Probable peptidoglycan glycosyltransferase FtsW n=1 Tax=Chondromyces crocatus TaxID=52 RepID=A0A0K1EN33_CHOCO|nr:putative lipid II flippase FtsW [Chondromyces crocatus]AKT42315.1 cell division protein FtsW [Chondromyces crocatus]